MTDRPIPDSQAIVAIPAATPDWADAWRHPELYDGVTLRRILAYVADGAVLLAVAFAVWFVLGFLTVLSFGVLAPLQALALALVPVAYHSLLVAGPRSATLGMRLFGIAVRSVAADSGAAGGEAAGSEAGGGRPTLFQAIIQVVSFYGSVALTGFLVLVVALFNSRRRTLHDWLAGTVVVRV